MMVYGNPLVYSRTNRERNITVRTPTTLAWSLIEEKTENRLYTNAGKTGLMRKVNLIKETRNP